MKVLGIDPGTRILGYAIVEYNKGRYSSCLYGGIRATHMKTISKRLAYIYENLERVIAEHQPKIAAIEKVFYGKNIQSAIRIGEARGIAMLAAARHQLEIYEYDATKIKKSIVGSGRAHKSQIQYMIQGILGLPELPTPADAADALAIAICHCQQWTHQESI